ncbi:hypothetical protein GHT09_000492 [Marmota monax]|uniref:Uncharacterized protein n=1 Tax=Marmota monax TaxID=9995 RepID=A0A834PWG9_MARMO|nr:hypothetical protein GHT09_000492 [Marmota monax]
MNKTFRVGSCLSSEESLENSQGCSPAGAMQLALMASPRVHCEPQYTITSVYHCQQSTTIATHLPNIGDIFSSESNAEDIVLQRQRSFGKGMSCPFNLLLERYLPPCREFCPSLFSSSHFCVTIHGLVTCDQESPCSIFFRNKIWGTGEHQGTSS